MPIECSFWHTKNFSACWLVSIYTRNKWTWSQAYNVGVVTMWFTICCHTRVQICFIHLYTIILPKFAILIFIKELLLQIFGGNICHEVKTNYFTPSRERCTVCYSFVLMHWLVPVRFNSRVYDECWKCGWRMSCLYINDWFSSIKDDFKQEIEELNTHDGYAVEINITYCSECTTHKSKQLWRVLHSW